MLEKLENLIDKFPEKPDDIAKFLAAEGIKGERGAAFNCPLAKYFKKEFPGYEVEIGLESNLSDYFLTIKEPGKAPLVGQVLPKKLNEFASKFDGEAYPNLEVRNA